MSSDVQLQVIAGTSSVPPALIADAVLGAMVCWTEENEMFFAGDQTDPPFQYDRVNSAWATPDTPALALALEWGRVYLAWTAPDGSVALANASDGWSTQVLVAPGGAAEFGPALAFGDGVLYAAWTTKSHTLSVAVFSQDGTPVATTETALQMESRPTLTWLDGSLYALSGGRPDLTGPQQMRIYRSTNGAKSFESLEPEIIPTAGPPSLVSVNGTFHLAWADGQTGQLCLATSTDLSTFNVMDYPYSCHNGGPALAVGKQGLQVGWSSGQDQHITVGTWPLSDMPQVDVSRYQTRTARMEVPCSSDEVYNPTDGTCAPKGSCLGRCLLGSFTGVKGVPTPVFNAISFAICMIRC